MSPSISAQIALRIAQGRPLSTRGRADGGGRPTAPGSRQDAQMRRGGIRIIRRTRHTTLWWRLRGSVCLPVHHSYLFLVEHPVSGAAVAPFLTSDPHRRESSWLRIHRSLTAGGPS
ncbi:unnamed protein product [Gadus morhua 'NCC']